MNKKQETNEFVKECITIALLNLMKEKNFNKIKISEITNNAGVGRVSFYRNFESKEDVILKYLNKMIINWKNECNLKQNYNLIEEIFLYYYKNKDFFILLYKQHLAYLSLENMKYACGVKKESSNLEAYASCFIAFGLYGWIEEWFLRGLKETPAEMAKLWEMSQKK